MAKPLPLAPPDLFERMLEYLPIPTFDLVVRYGNRGVVVVKRKIAPYKGVWALPGLRMYKGETIDQTLARIARQELGLTIKAHEKRLLGQFVGKFSTEHDRQDISTAYQVTVSDKLPIKINQAHFIAYKLATTIPSPIGAMYRYYLKLYFGV